MKSVLVLLLMFPSMIAVVRADSRDDAIIQPMRLTAAPNYSWITMISDEVGTTPIDIPDEARVMLER